MTEQELYYKTIQLCAEIAKYYNKITDIFPEKNEHILKHLAASSLHLTLFVKDIFQIKSGGIIKHDYEGESQFLEECGCNMKDKK